MAILKTLKQRTFLIRFLSSVMRKEIVAFLVFFIFNILFAQITVVDDAQIHGAENIKIQTYQSQVFVIEGTSVYNLENTPRIQITYLKKNTTESQKPNRENFAFQKTKLSAEKKAEKTTTEKNISKTTCVYTSGKNTTSFSSQLCNNIIVIPTHYKFIFTKIDTYYNTWNNIKKKKEKIQLLNKKFSSNCNSSYKIRPPPFSFFV